MDRIARFRRSELEKKLRDARKVLREIARSDQPIRSARLATWALELIFDEPRREEVPVDSAMSPLRLEIPIAPEADPAADQAQPADSDLPNAAADAVHFEAPKTRSLRVVRGGLPEELLRELIG